jgi:pimeloyl-ACP methyl ester carboxylesterase
MNLAVARRGRGQRAVLVHGGGAGGLAAFSRQLGLAESFELLLPDRPGAGDTPADGPQDAARDGRLIADLLGSLLTDDAVVRGPAHLVGHSYGGVAAMVAAALRPEAVGSLVVIEPPVYQLAADDPQVLAAWQSLTDAIADPEPIARVRRFFAAAGLPAQVPEQLPPPLQRLAEELPAMRQPWDIPLHLAALRRLDVRKAVVSGGHQVALERLSDRLAALIDAERVVLPGAGHAVQDVGEPFNEVLRKVWT